MSAVNLYDNDTLTWRHDGKLYLLHIQRDEDAESPRENDNLAIMACWHRRYSLGDKLNDKDSGAFWQRMVREYVPHTDVINAARNGKLTGIRLAENSDDKQRIDVYESVPWETSGDEPQEYLEHEGVDSRFLFDVLLDDLTNVQCQTLLRPYAVRGQGLQPLVERGWKTTSKIQSTIAANVYGATCFRSLPPDFTPRAAMAKKRRKTIQAQTAERVRPE